MRLSMVARCWDDRSLTRCHISDFFLKHGADYSVWPRMAPPHKCLAEAKKRLFCETKIASARSFAQINSIDLQPTPAYHGKTQSAFAMAHYPITEIAKRLHERRLILFVGAGMSMPYLPSWVGLLERLRDTTFADDPEGKAEVEQLIKEKQYLAAAWAIEEKTKLTKHNWRDLVQDEFGANNAVDDQAKAKLAAVRGKYEALRDLPFASYITTNYDRFLEDALQMPAITHKDTEEVIDLLRKPKLLKLHGGVATRESMILTAGDFVKIKHDRPELVLVMEAAAKLYSFLFIGYSMQDEDLLGWLERVCHRSFGKSGGHYALVEGAKWGRYRRQQYRELYDVEMVDAPALD